MRRIRRVEEAIVEHYPEQRMRCPVHLCIGQEAVAAGVCQALERRDQIVSGHRSHGHYLAKGGDLKAMMAEIYGKATGCSGGKGGSMHLIDRAAGFLGATPIVGGTIAMAVGVALAAKLRGETGIAVAFFGEVGLAGNASLVGTVADDLELGVLVQQSFVAAGVVEVMVCVPDRFELHALALGGGQHWFVL